MSKKGDCQLRYVPVPAGADRIGLLLVLMLIGGRRNVFLQPELLRQGYLDTPCDTLLGKQCKFSHTALTAEELIASSWRNN